MLAVTLVLTSCGGGNDGASTGTPVVAQATIASWCSNFNFQYGGTGSTNICGCANSSTFGGSGPALNQSQEIACIYAIYTVDNAQCSALGGSQRKGHSVACFLPMLPLLIRGLYIQMVGV